MSTPPPPAGSDPNSPYGPPPYPPPPPAPGPYAGPAGAPGQPSQPSQQPGYPGGPYGGHPNHPGPAGYPGYPGGPMPPQQPFTMPGVVRAAQVMGFVAGALVVLGAIVAGALAGAEASGRVVGLSLPVVGVFVCALLFGRAGSGARVTAIVFASLMIFFGLGALGQRNPGGALTMALGVAIVVTLSQKQAGHWFRRPYRG